MKRNIFFFSVFTALGTTALYGGFIEPTAFPKVASDLSFIDRVSLAYDGYAPLESKYDKNGKCISGCAYVQMNLEDEIAAMERLDAMVNHELVEDYGYTETENGELIPPQDDQPIQDKPTDNYDGGPQIPFPDDRETQYKNCSIKNNSFKNTNLPYRSPLGYVTCITSDFGVPRKLPWNQEVTVHHGIDLAANIGKPIYAPANGVVVTVFNMNRTCGNGIIIKHPSNYRTQYCHLSKVTVSKNEQIPSGCLIGYTGNTGPSTGPHLHYAVQKITSGGIQAVNPRKFMEPEHKMCR